MFRTIEGCNLGSAELKHSVRKHQEGDIYRAEYTKKVVNYMKGKYYKKDGRIMVHGICRDTQGLMRKRNTNGQRRCTWKVKSSESLAPTQERSWSFCPRSFSVAIFLIRSIVVALQVLVNNILVFKLLGEQLLKCATRTSSSHHLLLDG